MKLSHLITLSFAIIALAGCQRVSESSYVQMQKTLAKPAQHKQMVGYCSNRMGDKPLKYRQNLAVVTGTNIENMPTTFCRRIGQALASGRLTREDVNESSKGNLTPMVLKVIQGR
ncbi:hypothetical protein [Phyllobacterium sp. SB3]|uniref:hypothetical protein n=1 Tax=Phyllobacterium sp. SB3 TaxID=3156073 RepID=UPI0032AEBD35